MFSFTPVSDGIEIRPLDTGWCWVSIGRDIRGYYWSTFFFFSAFINCIAGSYGSETGIGIFNSPRSATLDWPKMAFCGIFHGRKKNQCRAVLNNNIGVKLSIRTKLTTRSVTGQVTVGTIYNKLPFLAIVPHKGKQCLPKILCQYQQFHLIIHLSLTNICLEGNVKGRSEMCPLALF